MIIGTIDVCLDSNRLYCEKNLYHMTNKLAVSASQKIFKFNIFQNVTAAHILILYMLLKEIPL